MVATPLNRATLAKVLGMLGSEHPGEVAAAANRATAMLQAAGTDWLRVLANEDGGLAQASQARQYAMAVARLQRMASEHAILGEIVTQQKAEIDRLRKENAKELARRVLAQANLKAAGFATLRETDA